MDKSEIEMQLIALLSGEPGEEHTVIECNTEEVEHICNERNDQRVVFHRNEVEFFTEGKVRNVKADFCEYCNHVFVSRAGE